jgi:hypothetical protein
MAAKGIMTIEYLDRPALGWFVLDVMREKVRGRDWVALMIDVEPTKFIQGNAPARQRWLRIDGEHKSRDAAVDALEAMTATRH